MPHYTHSEALDAAAELSRLSHRARHALMMAHDPDLTYPGTAYTDHEAAAELVAARLALIVADDADRPDRFQTTVRLRGDAGILAAALAFGLHLGRGCTPYRESMIVPIAAPIAAVSRAIDSMDGGLTCNEWAGCDQ